MASEGYSFAVAGAVAVASEGYSFVVAVAVALALRLCGGGGRQKID